MIQQSYKGITTIKNEKQNQIAVYAYIYNCSHVCELMFHKFYDNVYATT